MSTAGRFLLLFLLAWAASWSTPACFAGQEEGPPVRLVSPQAGATLVAGTTTELEWAPLDLPEIEEWEAFLSLDSGRTYPVRITPHLDQDLRQVRWQVPFLPTPAASILLRFGDERRETAVELPVRFSIVAPPAVLSNWLGTLPLARRASAPGEPALPGQAGVVAWMEGSRRGDSARQVIAADPSSGMRPSFTSPPAHREVSETASEPLPSDAFGRASAKDSGEKPSAGRRVALARAGAAPALSSDILLLIQRQNE